MLPNGGRRDLDSVVVNIELTLVSIIQGVALFFLTDNARAILPKEHISAFLYLANTCSIGFRSGE